MSVCLCVCASVYPFVFVLSPQANIRKAPRYKDCFDYDVVLAEQRDVRHVDDDAWGDDEEEEEGKDFEQTMKKK